MTSGGSVPQLALLVQMGVLNPFCALLDAKDWKTVVVVLDGLANILAAAEKMGEVERVAIIIEAAGGLDKLENLQHHENEQVYQKAVAMIDTFFSEGVSRGKIIFRNKIYTFTSNFIHLSFPYLGSGRSMCGPSNYRWTAEFTSSCCSRRRFQLLRFGKLEPKSI